MVPGLGLDDAPVVDVQEGVDTLTNAENNASAVSAIAASVVAGSGAGGYDDFGTAVSAMTGVKDLVYKPIPENQAVYAKLYKLYKQLHDGFGVADNSIGMGNVMKELLEIKEEAWKS